MNIQPQNQDRLQPLAEVLADKRVAMLTVHEPTNGLASRPMSAIEMDETGAIWFITARDSLPQPASGEALSVNLAFVEPGDGDYVSIAGVADLVDDAGRKQALWTLAARPWFTGPDDPRLTLLKVTPRHVEIWDSPDNAATRVLAMAGSVVAGKPIGLGGKTAIDVPPVAPASNTPTNPPKSRAS